MPGQPAQAGWLSAAMPVRSGGIGGRGTVVGTLCGALLLAVLANGLALIAAGSFAQQVFLGAVTIGAVALDRLSAPEST